MLVQRLAVPVVLSLGLALASCAIGGDDPPTVDEVSAPSAVARSLPEPPALGKALTAAPNASIVWECTTTGRWWATQASCLTNCAGGQCFVCGLDCQN
jgi:hypothetical protein